MHIIPGFRPLCLLERLGVPVCQGAVSLEEAREEIAAVRRQKSTRVACFYRTPLEKLIFEARSAPPADPQTDPPVDALAGFC